MFVTTIIFSIIILITSLLKKISFNNKIINYIFFCLNFICYISFIRLDIDVEIYSSYYDFNSLLILRISSISFIVWLIINIIFKFLNKRGKYEK